MADRLLLEAGADGYQLEDESGVLILGRSWREECINLGATHLWVFDPASGTVTDEIGGLVLTPTGSPTFSVTGPFPDHDAVQFDNVGDWFETPDHADLDLLTGTQVAVVRRDADSGSFQDLISKGSTGHVGGWTNGDKWQIGKVGVTTLSSESGTTPAPSGWLCMGISFNNAASSGKVYKDGADVTSVIAADLLQTNANPLVVGKQLASIAGLAYFPTVLSTADHLALSGAVAIADTVEGDDFTSDATWAQTAASWAATAAETITGTAAFTQAPATWSATAAKTHAASASFAQAAATWQATAAKTHASTATFSQAAASWHVTAAETFTGTATFQQVAAVWAATSTTGYDATAAFAQAAASWQAAVAETHASTAAWTQPAPTWAATAQTLTPISGTAAFEQQAASWQSTAAETFTGGATWEQAPPTWSALTTALSPVSGTGSWSQAAATWAAASNIGGPAAGGFPPRLDVLHALTEVTPLAPVLALAALHPIPAVFPEAPSPDLAALHPRPEILTDG